MACVCVRVCAPDRFGRDYFDKLSTGAAKSMFAEGLPDGVGSSDDNSQQESIDDELGVITLAGVNKVDIPVS